MLAKETTFGLLLTALAIVGAYYAVKTANQIKTRENYADLQFAKDYAAGSWVSRPSFRADLSPRFDSTRTAGGNILGEFPGMSVQGAPLSPVESMAAVQVPNYATMGGFNGAYGDSRLPEGGLTTSQVNTILSNKFGRGTSSSPDYTDPKELLPTPDMTKALARDPSDPNTYMYDRYIFAPLKRRYGQVNVDFIRGDLAIPQVRMGWFDPNPVARQDLTAGYFSDYLDIQQSTAIQDAIFERKPTAVQQATPWGRLGERTIYSMM